MAAVIEIPDEGEMLFIGTVLAPMFDTEPVRERQALHLTDLDRRHRRPLPTVLAGDFDAAPDNSSIRYLTGRQSLSGRGAFYFDAWDVAGDGPGFTWSIDNPNASLIMDDIIRQPGFRHRIDYVLVGEPMAHPGTYARITRAELAFEKPVDGVWPSDHFGLVVDLEVGHRDQAAH
jgi:endonuclease/exonuclease/phosphatase family metal-dependent hydrolase